LFAYGSSAAGVVLFDPILGATTVVGGLPASTEIHDLEFANGGRDLFVATQVGLFVVDVTSPAPAGSLFAAAVANSLAVDRVTGRLYALGGYSGLLTVNDAAAGAPGFGTVVGLTGHFAHTLDLSTDGRRLALAHAFGSIQVLNADASSPAYLQPIASATPAVIPTPGIGSAPVVVSGDGRVVSVPLRTGLPVPKSQLWRYDVDLGQWIDHDPAGAGVQPLSADVAPLLSTTFGYLIARNGVEAYAPNASGVQRLTYDLAEPTSFALQSTAMPASGAGGGVSRRYLTASPSGRYLTTRLAPLAGTGPNTFHVVDVATGAEVLLGTLAGGGGASAPGVGVWR
ncbi:MAG TPA: hypothetical protein VEI02_04500, partial [Planctomycetota bacterium]|nr:hypothetical protein [Planctomycetota bacterium]